MAVSDKELELLQKASDQLSANIARFSFIRLTLLAVLVFTFANAFKQIDQTRTAQVEALGPVTGIASRNLSIDRFQEFFLLDHLLSDRQVSFEGAPEFTALTQSQWNKAREVLIQYKDAKEEVEKNAAEIVYTTAAPPTVGGEAPGAVAEIHVTLPEEIGRSARTLQRQLAQDIQKNNREAFGLDLALLGSKLQIDLRNWLVFLPFFFLFSEVYLLILRKKRELLDAVLLQRVNEAETEAPHSVPTVYRLLLGPKDSLPSFYSRQPGRFVVTLYRLCSIGLLGYLVLWAALFSEGVGVVENFFNITVPVLTTLTLATLYAWFYYASVSTHLEEEIKQREGIVPRASRLMEAGRKLKNTCDHFVTRVPRFWLTSGGGLVLLTLLLAVSVDSCGRPKRGYELVKTRVVVESGLMPDGSYAIDNIGDKAWWFPALWSIQNLQEPKRSVVLVIELDQQLGRLVYLASLLLAIATLLLVTISLVKPAVLRSRTISRLLSLAAHALLLFIMADLCLYFVSPQLKFVLLGTCFAFSAILFLIARHFGARKDSEGASRVRSMLIGLWLPIVICSVMMTVIYCLLDGYMIWSEPNDQSALGLSGYLKIGYAVLADNVAAGLLTLTVGLSFVGFGWRQLYQQLKPGPASEVGLKKKSEYKRPGRRSTKTSAVS